MHRKDDGRAVEHWQIPELTVDGDQFELRMSPAVDDRWLYWMGMIFLVLSVIGFVVLIPIAVLTGEKGLSSGELTGVFLFALMVISNAYFLRRKLLCVRINAERVEFHHPVHRSLMAIDEIEEVLLTKRRFGNGFLIKVKMKGRSMKRCGLANLQPGERSTAERAIAILTEEFECRGIPCSSKLT